MILCVSLCARCVRILKQQLKEKEDAERRRDTEALFNSEGNARRSPRGSHSRLKARKSLKLCSSAVQTLQEELTSAQSRLQELQDDLTELRGALRDTQSQMREREAENAAVKTGSDSVQTDSVAGGMY